MGRAGGLLALALLAACQREPSFDERFANASATIANQSDAMDNQMRALETRERAEMQAAGSSENTITAKPTDTAP